MSSRVIVTMISSVFAIMKIIIITVITIRAVIILIATVIEYSLKIC